MRDPAKGIGAEPSSILDFIRIRFHFGNEAGAIPDFDAIAFCKHVPRFSDRGVVRRQSQSARIADKPPPAQAYEEIFASVWHASMRDMPRGSSAAANDNSGAAPLRTTA
jgi:hypothetical protein